MLLALGGCGGAGLNGDYDRSNALCDDPVALIRNAVNDNQSMAIGADQITVTQHNPLLDCDAIHTLDIDVRTRTDLEWTLIDTEGDCGEGTALWPESFAGTYTVRLGILRWTNQDDNCDAWIGR